MLGPHYRSHGPIAYKLASLREHIIQHLGGPPLSQLELQQVAAVIEALIPLIDVLEERPVPPKFRVIEGGREPPDTVA